MDRVHKHDGGRGPAGPVVVGGFTSGRAGARQGLGLHVAADGPGTPYLPVHVLDLPSPTFGAYCAPRRVLYVSHSAGSRLSAVGVDLAGGRLSTLDEVATHSTNPVHVTLSPDHRHLLAASFTSGHVGVVALAPDGGFAGPLTSLSVDGATGPRPEQTGSQPHQVVISPDGRHVLVPDRGTDQVHVYSFDGASGRLRRVGGAAATPGAGPRHLAFHPADAAVLFVVNELDSTVRVHGWDGARGRLTPGPAVPTIPPDWTGDNSAAGIAVAAAGPFVYVSNRGHDSVVRFEVAPDGSGPRAPRWFPAGGRTPRFIGTSPDGSRLWVCAQGSDLVTVFEIDPVDGALNPVGELAFDAPACVTFLEGTGR
ncbi:lactonase family protein [Jiangella endophytica]|uniref:lactonase family protein n=1 Tax=Jiangella endophytica TaxID=1623398 RepID=UPI000E350EBD|nr:beta-propeller fold lactonase family protein [Jiangella endophytica]